MRVEKGNMKSGKEDFCFDLVWLGGGTGILTNPGECALSSEK